MAELRLLTAEQLEQVYHRYMKVDFPPSERRPLASIRRLRQSGHYDTWGLWAGETLSGYAFLWRTEGEECALLDYLAVCPGERGRGWGTLALELIKIRYGEGCPILAEAEAPEKGAPPEQNEPRRRRLDFYRRAGFRLLDYETLIFGVRYAMLVWPASCAMDAETLQAAHRGLYQSQMPPYLFRRMIRIPAPDCGKKE